MARSALTLVRFHGTATLVVAIGTAVDFSRHLERFKQLNEKREHPQIAEIQIWQSDSGMVKRAQFKAPETGALPPPDLRSPLEMAREIEELIQKLDSIEVERQKGRLVSREEIENEVGITLEDLRKRDAEQATALAAQEAKIKQLNIEAEARAAAIAKLTSDLDSAQAALAKASTSIQPASPAADKTTTKPGKK